MEKIPPKIQALADALEAVGLKTFTGPVHWANGDIGYCIHSGEYIDELLKSDNKGHWTIVDGTHTSSLISFSFDSKCNLKDMEAYRLTMFLDDIKKHNKKMIRKHGLGT